MRFPLRNSSRLFLLAIAALCAFVATSATPAAAAEGRADVSDSISVVAPGSAAAGCTQRAVRTVRRLTAGKARSAAVRRRARRTETRQRRRCAKLRREAKRKASASLLPTMTSGNLVVAIDGGHGGWTDEEVEHRAALGAAVTRHEWDPYEPVDEQEDVMEEAAGEIHTRVHALLGGNDLGDPNNYRDFVVAFVRRYGVGGSFWAEHPEYDPRYAITTIELGNEPYFGEMSAEEYAATVRPTLEEIQRLQLPVQVVLPSRVYGKDTKWIDTLYRLIPDLNNLFHAFADHPYWYGHDPAEVSAAGPFGRIEMLRKRMNELGANTKPILITEYGESTASCGEECIDEGTQATHLRQMLEAAVNRPDWGIKMVSVFQLIDRGTNTSDRELGFGLLREDGSPKPAYELVRGAMQQYRG
jgi:hypothetical protein